MWSTMTQLVRKKSIVKSSWCKLVKMAAKIQDGGHTKKMLSTKLFCSFLSDITIKFYTQYVLNIVNKKIWKSMSFFHSNIPKNPKWPPKMTILVLLILMPKDVVDMKCNLWIVKILHIHPLCEIIWRPNWYLMVTINPLPHRLSPVNNNFSAQVLSLQCKLNPIASKRDTHVN